MWLKLIGASLVLASSSVTGNLIAKNFLERPKQLRQVRNGLQVLETEISYTASFLPQALERIARVVDAPVNSLFGRTSQLLLNQEGYTAGEAWQKAIEENLSSLAIKDRDKEILLQLGSSLGCSDREDQLKHLKLAQEYLKKEEEQAEAEGEKNAPLWRYFGLVLGAMIIILLY